MRKIMLLAVILALLTLQTLFTQYNLPVDTIPGLTLADTSWTSEFSAGLNFNLAAFSGNWKSGGINSVAFGSIIAGKANYATDRMTGDNEMELLFGIVSNDGEEIGRAS